ncbi:FAD-dependent oxidoreductase [Amycolatopsis dongchuanensis]|uniref:FAD-binding domain-containing protein n=1 Tax=Amycolatopsis dongchuanensis TaxID=1070866 RepID=A0ABP9QIL3_9PSEU
MAERDVSTVRFPDAGPPEDVEVLIIGAGPVGLSAAVELHARGVAVAVVDQAREATLVRAGAMGHTPRVVEHFRRWRVLQEIRDEWTFPPEWNKGIRLVTSLVGHELVPTPRPSFVDTGRGAAEEALRRPQTALVQVFLRHLARHGVRVSGGWRLTGLREDASGIEAIGESGGVIRAKYVLGADGGSSTVRRLAGIARQGEYATEKRVRLVVRTGDLSGRIGPAPSGTNIVVNQRADGFLAAISPREWRVYAGPFPLDHEPTEAELLDTARAAFGFDLDLELASATTFYHATRIAETFRAGRVLLAGDAAHVRTPGGNLGEGFGDVVNLGWKLAAVLRGSAPEELLDSYDAERRRHNWRVADFALRRSRRTQATLADIRRIGVPDDADLSPDARQRREAIGTLLRESRLGGDGVTFDERYDDSPVIWYEDGQLEAEPPWRGDGYTDDARPGHRAPNGVLDPYGGTLYDRIGNDFALLVLSADREAERAFTAEAAARRLPFTVVHLDGTGAGEVYDAPLVLVRPDQHVAWRGAALPEGGAAAVFDRVLGGSRVSPNWREPHMASYTEFYAPQGLRTRGTVIVVPGRGETQRTYTRLGKRLAADAYEVRIIDAPRIDQPDVLTRLGDTLTEAAGGATRPLALLGADTGATALAALVASDDTSAPWWPDALVLAGPAGGATGATSSWDEELDLRTHCPAHRAVLSGDEAFARDALAVPVPPELLDAAYGRAVELPHLVLVGDADPLVDRETLSRAVKAAPAARLAVVGDAHHDVLNDLQHRSVAAEIVSFLETLGNRLVPVISVESSTW